MLTTPDTNAKATSTERRARQSAAAAVSLAAALCLAASAAAQQAESLYTDLAAAKCKNIKLPPEAIDSSRQECAGVAGYRLIVDDGDSRQTVTVVAPGGAEHPLELWHTVSGAFSTVGQKAEWRVRKSGGRAEPYALIVRFNASEQPDRPEKIVSYLAVAKITPEKICVTDKIPPGAQQNERARAAADAAASRPCVPADGGGPQ